MSKKTTPKQSYELFYFWKEHCAPCKVARPIVERVATEHQYPVQYLDARSPEGEQYIIPFGLMAVPTLVVVVGSKPVARITGPDLQKPERLAKLLAQHLTP